MVLKYGEPKFYDPAVRTKSVRVTDLHRCTVQNIIEVKTTGDLDEKDHLKWILFTNLKEENFGDAFRVLDFYKKRWHIENFFKVLKDGG